MTATSAEEIVHLDDFTPPACEAENHEVHGSGPATLLVLPLTPLRPCGCARARDDRPVCSPCWDRMVRIGAIRCTKCGAGYPLRASVRVVPL